VVSSDFPEAGMKLAEAKARERRPIRKKAPKSCRMEGILAGWRYRCRSESPRGFLSTLFKL